MSIKSEIKTRMTIVFIGVLLVSVLVVGRIFMLQIIEGEKWRKMQVSERQRSEKVNGNRGDILAADGRILASSVPSYSVHIDFKAGGMTRALFMQNVDSLALCLSRLYGDMNRTDYKNYLMRGYKSGSRFFNVNRRRINHIQLQKLKKFPLFRLGPNKGGVIITQYDTRKLPFGNLAARTLGKLDFEKTHGILGMEKAYDTYLRGKEGVAVVKPISGRWMKVNIVEPEDGFDVVSTIDINIQDVAETALRTQLSRHGAQHGCAILMEVKTGEIRAIANLEKTGDGRYDETYNFAIGEAAEPGSTFKLASMIAAFEDGYIELSDTFDTGKGVVNYYGVPMRDSHDGGYGKISVKEIFQNSSNVGVSKIIDKYYGKNPQRFVDRILDMGLNEKLEIDIAGEAEPFIASPENKKQWSGLSLPWMSIGYEVKLAPIHTLTFYNAIANNGKMVKPIFAKGISYHGKMVESFETEVIKSSVCSGSTLKKVRKKLEGFVEYGTATNIKNDHYTIAGKTGTAQIAQGKAGYKQKRYYASFCGYFPADKPKYTCIVVVNSPSSSVFYGNVLAGTVFREIADKVYVQNLDMQKKTDNEDIDDGYKVPVTLDGNRHELITIFDKLDIDYKDDSENHKWVLTKNKGEYIDVVGLGIRDGLVPNVLGMGAKDALFLLENAGLSVSISGVGRVVEQSLLPGSRINNVHSISIRLR